MQNKIDTEILDLLVQNPGDEKGFSLLMDHYQEKIYWHIRKMVYHHEDANDVVQNVFIKFFRNIQKFKGESSLYTWIYRIATNESLRHIDKKKRKTSVSLEDDENANIHHLKADTYFDDSKVEVKLQEALMTLPDKQRLVFNMRYYDEMNYQKMSEILETSVGALKASYHHAVKKIEKYLTEVPC